MKAVDEEWDTRLGTVLAKKIFFFLMWKVLFSVSV